MGRGAEGFEGTGDHGIHGNGLGDKGRRGAPFLEKVSETGPQSAGLPGARSTPGDPAFQLMGNRRETSTGTLFLRVTPAVPASGDHRALPAASVAPGTGGGGGEPRNGRLPRSLRQRRPSSPRWHCRRFAPSRETL